MTHAVHYREIVMLIHLPRGKGRPEMFQQLYFNPEGNVSGGSSSFISGI